MSAEFHPHKYQSIIMDWIKTNKRSAVFAGMGLGKTVSVLSALVDISKTEPTYPVLVIAPLRVAKTTWPNEVLKWQHTAHLRTSVMCGSLKDREAALVKDADVYTTNYESLPWLVERIGSKWPFKIVVADECTRLKGFRTRQGSMRAKALARVAHTLVNRIILLTGTPAPNGLLDLWGQMWFVDRGERLGKSYSAFLDKWFTSDYFGYTFTPKSNAQKEIQDAISDACTTIKMDDWFDVDKPVVNKLVLPMPKKAASLYKAMEKEMFAELESGDIEATSAAAKTMKCRQIAAGALYNEAGEWEEIHREKLTALESIVEESNGMPLLVAYHFKSDLQRLVEHFPKGRFLDNNPDTEKQWNAGKIPLLFLHPSSAGFGLNLQDGGNTIVFFSCDWAMENHVQVIERIGPMRQKQSGHHRAVIVHYLVMGGTIDEDIYERLEGKKSVQEVLTDAMNKYKRR